MKSLELGDIVKVVEHSAANKHACMLSIGELCRVVEIGEDNKRFNKTVHCRTKSLRFCRKSDEKK